MFRLFMMILILCNSSCLILSDTSRQEPPNFPKSMKLILEDFNSWTGDNFWPSIWTGYPKSAQQVLEVANWALDNGWQLRASGKMHTWAPFTFPPQKTMGIPSSKHPNVILLKTDYLTSMEIISKKPGQFSFWAQPGISMDQLLTNLEDNNMGFAHHPNLGVITLGGVLAVGGHGIGTTAIGEQMTPGHTHGSISNLIISLTAVVFDVKQNKFILKKFTRSQSQTKTLLVHLGRTFVTNVTLRAGPLQYVRCQSYTNIRTKELFADPGQGQGQNHNRGLRTLTKFVDESGRVEAIVYPFVKKTWLKVWTVLNAQNSNTIKSTSRFVKRPYNYGFYDKPPKIFKNIINSIRFKQWESLARPLASFRFKYVNLALKTYKLKQTFDIYGASKNVILYAKPEEKQPKSHNYHVAGFTVVSSRSNIQKIVHWGYSKFNEMIHDYAKQNQYPINRALGIRVSGLDNPKDVRIKGAETPSISASSLQSSRPDFDTAVWFNFYVDAETVSTYKFLRELEQEFAKVFDGSWATYRAEWTKGWGYSDKGPWSNYKTFKDVIAKSLEGWNDFLNSSQNYSGNVFTNDFLENLFM